jgi:phosphoglycolate phosphatase-like HAD superfamily hydrolase
MRIVFDLDGTLANLEHRLPLIKNKPKDWPGFFRACVMDKPIPHMCAVYRALFMAGHQIEIWSGRSDVVRKETEAWLERHGLQGYTALRMRQDGDYRADNIVKAEWLAELGKDNWPAIVFDDRDRVVAMWRSHGIPCCQVAEGEF